VLSEPHVRLIIVDTARASAGRQLGRVNHQERESSRMLTMAIMSLSMAVFIGLLLCLASLVDSQPRI
jgi:hypothetical protein